MLSIARVSFRWLLKRRIRILLTGELKSEFFPYEELLLFGFIKESGELNFLIEAGIVQNEIVPLFKIRKIISRKLIKDCAFLREIQLDGTLLQKLENLENQIRMQSLCDVSLQRVRNDRSIDRYRNPDYPDYLTCYYGGSILHKAIAKTVGYDGDWLLGRIVGGILANQLIRLEKVDIPKHLDAVLMVKK